MAEAENDVPVFASRQFDVPAWPKDKPYLGDADVVHDLVGRFVSDVLAAHHEFLAGNQQRAEAMGNIQALIDEYGGIFMGTDERYNIAPWQGERMRGTLVGVLPKMKWADDPGKSLFEFIALQAVRASISMAEGMPDSQAGPLLRELMDSYIGIILKVNY